MPITNNGLIEQSIPATINKREIPASELKASEIRYRRLFEASMDGILLLDAFTLEIVDVNPFMLDLLGYSRDEFLGKELWEIGLFGDKGASQAALKGLQESGYLRYEDLPLETQGGKRREVEFVSNVYEEDGRKVIQCNIRDITERRQQEVLRERLAAIVKSSDDAIISTDLDSIVTTWNSAAEKMFGHTEQEMLGRSQSIIIPPDRKDEVVRILKMMKRGETLNHFETVRIRKDGIPIDVSVTISPIKDEEGNIIGASKIARNISELKRAVKEIHLLNAQLEQRVTDRTAQLQAVNNELESFSYSVSHDLRAPLRHINGFSGALLEDYGDVLDEVGKGYLTQVCEASTEMAQLIDDVLQLARVSRTEMVPEIVNLTEIAHSVVEALQKEYPDREVSINIGEGLAALGDRRLIQILLTNLIGNAWKFTAKTENAAISFDQELEKGENVYFVGDNGAGFDMAFSDKLFGAFQRLHGADEFDGTGIGLATVQRIINRHQGWVRGEGSVDIGATFYFTLPQIEGAEHEK